MGNVKLNESLIGKYVRYQHFNGRGHAVVREVAEENGSQFVTMEVINTGTEGLLKSGKGHDILVAGSQFSVSQDDFGPDVNYEVVTDEKEILKCQHMLADVKNIRAEQRKMVNKFMEEHGDDIPEEHKDDYKKLMDTFEKLDPTPAYNPRVDQMRLQRAREEALIEAGLGEPKMDDAARPSAFESPVD